MTDALGVTFVVPVRNGADWIEDTLTAIDAEADGRPFEVIVVDDGSEDGSSDFLRAWATGGPHRVIAGAGRGAASALNLGVAAARNAVICQLDQDVQVEPGWLAHVTAALADPATGAVQGRYVPDPCAGFFARVMGFDLDARYAAIRGAETSHVCTGNAAYRADAIRRVGGFDETLGYGYDNDMSYRLAEAGYRLAFCREARAAHGWREGLPAYLRQQYGFGYGRLDLVARYPERWTGDSVSPLSMMMHPLLMMAALLSFGLAAVLQPAHAEWRVAVWAGVAGVGALAAERLAAGIRTAWRARDITPLWFPLAHLARDLAWVLAIVMWAARRLGAGPQTPLHSMRPRPSMRRRRPTRPTAQTLCVIPAHNEGQSLTRVVDDLRAHAPDLAILVVDDGSTDGTPALVEQLGVRWLRLPVRMGVGSAMRAGLRYAARHGYDAIVRLDGDGQHQARDVVRLLAPIHAGHADAVLGSRYRAGGPARPVTVKLVHRALAACIAFRTGRRVTDPTSGFWAFGPDAIALLSEQHPTGYPEPELRLLLSRRSLSVVEVGVEARARLSGASTLTPGRLTAAGARVLLALVVAPARSAAGGIGRD